ncbi:hypothetical protein I551_0901 [Mycobacterium ulcerans str. Harvey]|uniref:Uncharacterized protein n=1 Tax=Mycobacterium ulcerans str. Harvey TaxID=1299332 RepID=A0ABN0R6B1_MYCUL|nr:hypothetical protein I551_0901 [Mycobacterium ulcerans str. Harvey]
MLAPISGSRGNRPTRRRIGSLYPPNCRPNVEIIWSPVR